MAKRTRFFLMAILFLIIFAIIIRPEIFINSAKTALSLFGLSVFPSLFPFMFFSTILTSIGAGYELGKISKKPIAKLYNAPPIGGYIWVMSLLAGYPVCAKIIEDCYNKNLLTTSESKIMLTFSQTSPPLFVLGTVGVCMLGSYKCGFIILISQYIGSFLSGLLLRKKEKPKDSLNDLTFNVDNILQSGMEKSILSVLLIGGYVIVFNLILQFFETFGIINLFAEMLNKIGLEEKISVSILSSLFEVTNGILKLSTINIALGIKCIIICFLLSLGGLSIIMQSMSFLKTTKIKFSYFIKTRLVIATFSSIICFILTILLL